MILSSSARAAPSDASNFERDVLPILQKCVACHGGEESGGLRLDSRAAVLEGGQSGPAVHVGDSNQSLLIHMVTVGRDGLVMPPDGERLTADQVSALRRWIEQQMPWPEELANIASDDPRVEHWAFQSITRPEIPTVRDNRWLANPIDNFILAKLEAKNIQPSPSADRSELLRRLSLDLTGLPPTIEEADRFSSRRNNEAYAAAVNRLLASPRFGERWGRHWLDVARYADSDGFEGDGKRSIWKYREWVIKAINKDMPFDQFVREQLAGDLLPNATTGQQIATGFLRCGKGYAGPNASYSPQFVVDRLNTVGRGLMGITLGCAQCHAHKFDPISQREYYEMYAFLNSGKEKELELGTPEDLAQCADHAAEVRQLEEDLERYKAQLLAKLLASEVEQSKLNAVDGGEDATTLLSIPADKLTVAQKETVQQALIKLDVGLKTRFEQVLELKNNAPKLQSTLVVEELEQPRITHVLVRGDFNAKGPQVQPGVPACLPPLPDLGDRTPNRVDLAGWLISRKQPLTARVLVNRVWQRYFGTGLVDTEDNFGLNGAQPTHPKLLDWLTCELMDRQWSLKPLHQLIVCSATYQQSSLARPELAEIDPRNRLLARQSRIRLEAETIRDQALMASGLLQTAIGGWSVFPYQADGIMAGRADRTKWEIEDGTGRFRRGMYIHYWRLTPHPFLTIFDVPDAAESCTHRQTSNTPLQALTLLNDPWFTEFSVGMAQRILQGRPDNDEEGITKGFRWCLARSPSSVELRILLNLLQDHRQTYSATPENALRLSEAVDDQGDPVSLAAWTGVARALFNLDEFVVRP